MDMTTLADEIIAGRRISRQDDLNMFLTCNLRELCEGTPLENQPQLTEDEILRTIAFFRYINPEANIRLAAGRALLTNDGELAFQAGASATITGNMLTTAACATIRSDKQMLESLGRDVTPDYLKAEN